MNITFKDFFNAYKANISEEVIEEQKLLSDSDKVNFLFDLLITEKHLCNKNGEQLYLDKSRVSLILNCKSNVPTVISEEYHFLKTNKTIRNKYILFFRNCISNLNIDNVLIQLNINGKNKYETLYDCFVDSLITKNKKPKADSLLLWEKGCNSIWLTSGDIFDKCFKRKTDNNIIVVPVNSNFEAHVSRKSETINPLVSSQTLHGQWIQRCKNANLTEDIIKKRIKNSLDMQYSNLSHTEVYPIGTIVPFDTQHGMTYLLNISCFDKNNIAHSDKDKIRNSIIKLIEFYDYNGQGYPLYIPLIGTGRSRANLSYQQSFELIEKTLLENEEHIQGKIYIIALNEVYEKIKEMLK